MRLADATSGLGLRRRLLQTTVRWRLTVLYGGLFLACGAALLAITYLLVAHATITPARPRGLAPRGSHDALTSSAGRATLKGVIARVRIADLHQLVIESAIALAIMAVLSTLLGWIVAGRVLAPLRKITAATQQISDTNLHQRLAIAGPRDELRRLADTIDGLLGRLEVAFEAQRRFAANASHELRTPLTAMRVAVDIAIAKPQVSPQVQALDANLRRELDHADQLLESFLVLARAQHGEISDHTSVVSLAQLVQDALTKQHDTISAKQITSHTALGPAQVSGSRTLLARMVENLIDNAVRHNQTHGTLDITAHTDADQARLIVESDGPILDQDAVTQLAQPFHRLAPDRTGSQNGHGLGLSIVAAVAAAHGGTLELQARDEGGLRAQVALPAAASTPSVKVSL
jgi:signal transduction histidine kinase